MAEILLTNPDLLKSRTDLGVNYNDDDLENSVLEAQEIDLRGDIGKPLYKALQQHVQSYIQSQIAIPEDYSALLDDYILPYLRYRSYWYLLETLYTSTRASGLSRRGGANSLSREAYHQKRDSIAGRFEHYQGRLKGYIANNYDLFPEYETGMDEDLKSDRPDTSDERSSLPVGNPRRRYATNPLAGFKNNN